MEGWRAWVLLAVSEDHLGVRPEATDDHPPKRLGARDDHPVGVLHAVLKTRPHRLKDDGEAARRDDPSNRVESRRDRCSRSDRSDATAEVPDQGGAVVLLPCWWPAGEPEQDRQVERSCPGYARPRGQLVWKIGKTQEEFAT